MENHQGPELQELKRRLRTCKLGASGVSIAWSCLTRSSILDKAKPWVEDDDCTSFDNFLPASLLSANSPSGHYNTAYHFASILGVLGRRNTSTRAFRNKDGSIDERPLTLLAYNSGDVLPLPKHECDGPHAAYTAKSLSAVLLNGILCCCVRANAGSDVPASEPPTHRPPQRPPSASILHVLVNVPLLYTVDRDTEPRLPRP
ncbi:hypothetical protein CCM_09135 [Cordyceps militaris CM01]|uniref:Uncharacterized protein n=1 Tax=Cordyceps militaris (strain CM01) TaxID=983644 RepID=G3JTJ5_CORMM|nr:uncharacterized protein CCM_09135 [Cordyceps militaris CM01]EGX87999.1 hypothetical protein CCM_09135 [Cordyceps militaris CM01]